MNEEEIINQNLEKLESNIDDFIKRRINHHNFSKILYYLWTQSKKGDFVYVNELSRFTKLTKARSYTILNELCEVFLLEKRHTGNLVEYWFVKNDGKVLIENYIPLIKKILGLE